MTVLAQHLILFKNKQIMFLTSSFTNNALISKQYNICFIASNNLLQATLYTTYWLKQLINTFQHLRDHKIEVDTSPSIILAKLF